MPYDIFSDLSRYVEDLPRKQRAKGPRSDRPVSEWGIRDVIQEFRDQYTARYPDHSPDELGSMVTLSKILGSLRKQGVTVEHMHASIQKFWAAGLDKSHPDSPAWKKWLWKVRNTRTSDPSRFKVQQYADEVRPERAPAARVEPSSIVVHDEVTVDGFTYRGADAEVARKYLALRAIYDALDSAKDEAERYSVLCMHRWQEIDAKVNRSTLSMYASKLDSARLSATEG